MRVPEAYLLLPPFEAIRPGLLVLDPDARRIASISLKGKPDLEAVVAALVKSQTTSPRERVLLRVPVEGTEAVIKGLQALAGAEVPRALPGGFVEVWGGAAAVTPTHVAAIATATKHEIEIVDPVPVRLSAIRPGVIPKKAASGIAGLRHVATDAAGDTAWITRWLLHPRHLEAVGLRGDVAAITYRFETLPVGARVVKHLKQPFAEKGVLTVIPRIAEDAIEVVVRPTQHDAKATLAALVKGGLTAKP